MAAIERIATTLPRSELRRQISQMWTEGLDPNGESCPLSESVKAISHRLESKRSSARVSTFSEAILESPIPAPLRV